MHAGRVSVELPDLLGNSFCDLGAPVMGLHTTIVMDVARAMYERMGFTRFPENDLPITDDFVVMAYTLPL